MWVRVLLALLCCLAGGAAAADEEWICKLPESYSAQPVAGRYLLQNHMLIAEQVPFRRYTVLVENDVALIGAFSSAIDHKTAQIAGLPPVAEQTIGTEILIINRKTGEAVRGAVLLGNSNPPRDTGSCKKV